MSRSAKKGPFVDEKLYRKGEGLFPVPLDKAVGVDVPEYPTLFAKFARCLIGARDPIVLPAVSERVDWEAELAFVIGSEVRHADRAEVWTPDGPFTVEAHLTSSAIASMSPSATMVRASAASWPPRAIRSTKLLSILSTSTGNCCR